MRNEYHIHFSVSYHAIITHSKEFIETRYFLFGDIFRTRLDFSGSLLRARNVVVLLDSPLFHIPTSSLKLLGYHGYYGSTSQETSLQMHYLAKIVLDESSYVSKWESVVTPLIHSFLHRLIFESSFSFADRVNLLACEVVSTVFLGMRGFSSAFFTSLEGYLTTCQNPHSHLNASLPYKQQICNAISTAILEEDRKFYSKNSTFLSPLTPTEKSRDSILNELLLAVDSLLGEDTREDMKVDLIFIFLIEFVYRGLVLRLRSLLFHILVNHPSIVNNARVKYAEYLQTKQVSTRVSVATGGGGGNKQQQKGFSWASVINHDIPVPPSQSSVPALQQEEKEEEESNKRKKSQVLQFDQVLTNTSSSDTPSPPLAGGESLAGRAQSALSSVWTGISSLLQQSPSRRHLYGDDDTSSSDDDDEEEEAGGEKKKEAQEEEVQQVLDETTDLFGDTDRSNQQAQPQPQSLIQEQEQQQHLSTPPRHHHHAQQQQQPRRAETPLIHLRRRENAAFTFVEMIQQAVHDAKVTTVIPELPLQYSLRLCEQTAIIQRRLDDTKKQFYQLNIHDVLLIVHNPSHLLSSIETSTTERYGRGVDIAMEMNLPHAFAASQASVATATVTAAEEDESDGSAGHLGRFADLIMNIFLHELIVGYTWTTTLDPLLDVHDMHPVTGYNSVQDGSLQVKGFHSTNNISFMMSEGML